MTDYFGALQSNTVPLPFFGVVAIWVLLYLVSHGLAQWQRGLAKSHPQEFITTEEPPPAGREHSLGVVLVHVLLTVGIFGAAAVLGPPALGFLAGGWVVTTAVSIPITLRRILFQRGLSGSDAASGSVICLADASEQPFHINGRPAAPAVANFVPAEPVHGVERNSLPDSKRCARDDKLRNNKRDGWRAMDGNGRGGAAQKWSARNPCYAKAGSGYPGR